MAAGNRATRILHCPTNLTGHAAALAAHERRAGFDSRLVTLSPSRYGFGADESLAPLDAGRARREMARAKLLWRALRWADVVHFNFGSSILPGWPRSATGPQRFTDGLRRTLAHADVRWLRRAGKRIVVTFEGSDCRTSRSSDLVEDPLAAAVLREQFPPSQDEWRRRGVALFDQDADLLFALTPDLLDHLPTRAEYLPAGSVDPSALRPRRSAPRRPLRVVHAPTSRRLKGTDFLVAACATLHSQGVPIDLRLVEGVTHDAAREAFADADLVVDQLVLGWYGVAAVEAMALGKPVGCFIDSGVLRRAPGDLAAALPVLRTTASSITDDLRRWASLPPSHIESSGDASRCFATDWHDPGRIAARVMGAYRAVGIEPVTLRAP